MKKKSNYEQPSIDMYIIPMEDVLLASETDITKDIWGNESDTELY